MLTSVTEAEGLRPSDGVPGWLSPCRQPLCLLRPPLQGHTWGNETRPSPRRAQIQVSRSRCRLMMAPEGGVKGSWMGPQVEEARCTAGCELQHWGWG